MKTKLYRMKKVEMVIAEEMTAGEAVKKRALLITPMTKEDEKGYLFRRTDSEAWIWMSKDEFEKEYVDFNDFYDRMVVEDAELCDKIFSLRSWPVGISENDDDLHTKLLRLQLSTMESYHSILSARIGIIKEKRRLNSFVHNLNDLKLGDYQIVEPRKCDTCPLEKENCVKLSIKELGKDLCFVPSSALEKKSNNQS